MAQVNLTSIKALRGKLRAYSPELLEWKRESARRWRQYHYDRYRRYAKGQGTWKKTKRWKSGESKYILRKTHTLYKSLTPEYRRLPGQYQLLRGYQVQVGISGGVHPEFKGGTVGDLADIHNEGKGRMPRRQIVVRLPRNVVRNMVNSLERKLHQ